MSPLLLALTFTGGLVAIHAGYTITRRIPPRARRRPAMSWWQWVTHQFRPERPMPTTWRVNR